MDQCNKQKDEEAISKRKKILLDRGRGKFRKDDKPSGKPSCKPTGSQFKVPPEASESHEKVINGKKVVVGEIIQLRITKLKKNCKKKKKKVDIVHKPTMMMVAILKTEELVLLKMYHLILIFEEHHASI